jgi:hypothetical protein
MKPYIDLAISVLTLVTLVSGLYFAIRRFGLKRERFTFLKLTVETKTVWDAGDVALVAITVHLENKGDTRINVRTGRKSEDARLYDIGPDICFHAGTLKVRPVPEESSPLLFDWYSLPPLRMVTRLMPRNKVVTQELDLEQINYLDEFQDPVTDFLDVDFWLEPRDTYDQSVFLWLQPGVYAAKAYFLGPETRHHEEEYWSTQVVFAVASLPKRATGIAT